MAGHSALPPGAVLGEGVEPPWAGLAGGLPGSPGEAANPFSFKAFVRSQEQKAATASSHGGTETSSPEGSLRSCFQLEESTFLAESLGLNKDLRDPFFEDPTALDSLLQEDEDDWSGSYRPSAVEEAHLARAPSASLSGSPLNSFSCNLSDLQSFSPEQLERNDDVSCSCLGKEEQSSPSDGTSPEDGFCRLLQLRYHEVQMENYRLENLKVWPSREPALVRQNADVALQNLLAVITRSKSSINWFLVQKNCSLWCIF